MAIRLFITGGTIDGFDCSNPDQPSIYLQSRIPELLANARLNEPLSLETVVFKDGRSISAEDRKKLLVACKRAKEKKILISHGTSTLVQTAQYLSEAKMKKLIVLFGAARPLAESDSDAPFNLGFALGSLNALSSGVFVAMNGQLFSADNVAKDVSTGRFKSYIAT